MSVTIRGTFATGAARLYVSGQECTAVGTFGPSNALSPSVITSGHLTLVGPMIAGTGPAVKVEWGGVLHVTGPAYSMGRIAAFSADEWDVVAGYNLAIITQDTQDPPHPIALVMNPWAVEVAPGVTAADRLLATATIDSTGAQIAAATAA